MPRLAQGQQQIVAEINRVARTVPRHLRHKFKLAAIETGLVESGLRNLNYGDADSKGWRQERTSIYGPSATNVPASVARFRDEFLQHYQPGETAGQVAADVQRPAQQYRGRYQAARPQALAILGQSGGMQAPSYRTVTNTQTTPGVDNSMLRQQLKLSYLNDRGNPDALLSLAYGLRGAQDVAPVTTTSSRQVRSSAGQPNRTRGRLGEITISPNADRPGVRTQKAVRLFVRRIAGLYGQPLTIGTGTNHSQMTVNGNVSDHWTGRAADIPLTGRALIRAGQDALIAAGMPRRQARKQTGGLFNVGGKQIIFNTHIGGDHTNHLHVGLGSR